VRRVVVVGAGGFLGSHARAALERRGDELTLTCVDRCPRPPGLGDWRELDVLAARPGTLDELIGDLRPDVVVNSAGLLAGDLSALVTCNLLLVARLLEAIAGAAPGARFVHLGSAAEYGVAEEAAYIAEDHPATPVSAYGITKLAATQLIARRHAEGAIEAIVLRVFNPVGAGLSHHTVLGRAASLMRQASRDDVPRIDLGDLSAVRDFVPATDVGEAIARACTCASPGDVLFNVGSGVARTVREMVVSLAAVAGYRGAIGELRAGSPRSGAVGGQAANVGRARRAFAWAPSPEPTEALRALWRATGA
jgi:NDP-hexose 4-ketoreductase